MDDHFSSVDSDAAAPLWFEVEDTKKTDPIPVRLRSESGRSSARTHQKLSLSTYESLCHSGEITQNDQGPRAITASDLLKNDAGYKSNNTEPEVFAASTVQTVFKEVGPQTSTPIKVASDKSDSMLAPELSPLVSNGDNRRVEERDPEDSRVNGIVDQTLETSSRIDPRTVRVPVVGYETLPQRTRFTVYKLHVHRGPWDNWFVFRRYSDFVHLQRKLKQLFPLRFFHLPPRRWLRDNYEEGFLDDRKHGLQSFIDSILFHEDLCNSTPVKEFFCFSDPPGPYDSMEQSRAFCGELEEANYQLKMTLRERDTEIDLLRDELGLYKKQVELLSQALREQKVASASNSSGSLSLLAEINQSEASAHQNTSADKRHKGKGVRSRIDQSDSSLHNGEKYNGAILDLREIDEIDGLTKPIKYRIAAGN